MRVQYYGSQWCLVYLIDAGRISKVEEQVVVVIIWARSAEKNFWCPPLFSCAQPVFDGIRGIIIKVKQF